MPWGPGARDSVLHLDIVACFVMDRWPKDKVLFDCLYKCKKLSYFYVFFSLRLISNKQAGREKRSSRLNPSVASFCAKISEAMKFHSLKFLYFLLVTGEGM
jgi:hypothetical protein